MTRKFQIVIELDEDEISEEEMTLLLEEMSGVCVDFDINNVGILPVMRIINEKEN